MGRERACWGAARDLGVILAAPACNAVANQDSQ